jgi:uncharacterized protein YqjF (DUF2071 family)
VRFLTAKWSHLALLNYPVPTEALTEHLPPGCVPDTSLDGRAYVSLVAFDFLDTRVLGVSWPGFRNFPEINLRAYVRGPGGERGVVFVRELVPQRFVAAMARWTYNEPYLAVPMRSEVREEEGELRVRHRAWVAGMEQTIDVRGEPVCCEVARDGTEAWFKEHRWGFNRSRSGRLIRYEVVHPTWRCFKVKRWELKWDFAKVYGEKWRFLNSDEPATVVLAEGSGVEVRLWNDRTKS